MILNSIISKISFLKSLGQNFKSIVNSILIGLVVSTIIFYRAHTPIETVVFVVTVTLMVTIHPPSGAVTTQTVSATTHNSKDPQHY